MRKRDAKSRPPWSQNCLSMFMIIIQGFADLRKGVDMRTRLICLILILGTLVSCNLPQAQPATSTPDFIATQIVNVITQQAETQSVTPTLSPSQDLPDEPTQTEAATASATPTASPTATSSPEDPRVLLGPPSFTDTLETGKSFGLESQAYDDDYTFIRVENGQLLLTSRYATGFRGWRTGGTKLKDAYIEAKVKVGECSGSDTYGLVFRSPDFIKGYWFQVTCDGAYELGYYDGSEYSRLTNSTSTNNALLTGSNQTNRLGVWTEGNLIKLYINGKLVSQSESSALNEAGSFGAVIASATTPNLTIAIDEFTYWKFD